MLVVMNRTRFWDVTSYILVEVPGVSNQQIVTVFRVEEKHEEAIKGKQQFDWPCSMNATNASGHTAVTHACNWNSGLLFFCLRLESEHKSSGNSLSLYKPTNYF
jgi:hypothetical protein